MTANIGERLGAGCDSAAHLGCLEAGGNTVAYAQRYGKKVLAEPYDCLTEQTAGNRFLIETGSAEPLHIRDTFLLINLLILQQLIKLLCVICRSPVVLAANHCQIVDLAADNRF